MSHPVILLGGVSGTDYLVYASGINQPRALRGSVKIPDFGTHASTIGHKTMGIKRD